MKATDLTRGRFYRFKTGELAQFGYFDQANGLVFYPNSKSTPQSNFALDPEKLEEYLVSSLPVPVRWNCKTGRWDVSPEIDRFLEEISQVCRKHNLVIGHEDEMGAFVVEKFSEKTLQWLNAAYYTPAKPKETS